MRADKKMYEHASHYTQTNRDFIIYAAIFYYFLLLIDLYRGNKQSFIVLQTDYMATHNIVLGASFIILLYYELLLLVSHEHNVGSLKNAGD